MLFGYIVTPNPLGPSVFFAAKSLRIVFIPEGFKLIAVGKRCATPTDSFDRRVI